MGMSRHVTPPILVPPVQKYRKFGPILPPIPKLFEMFGPPLKYFIQQTSALRKQLRKESFY